MACPTGIALDFRKKAFLTSTLASVFMYNVQRPMLATQIWSDFPRIWAIGACSGHERMWNSGLLVLREVERGGVDAEALPGRLARAVIENVAEMAATGGAEDFGAPHAETRVLVELDVPGDGAVETRPAAIAVELGVR